MWTVAQDRMTLTEATPTISALVNPPVSDASRSESPTPIRLITLARIRTRAAVPRVRASIPACPAVASPSIPRTISQTQTMKTVAATFHPISAAVCHGVASKETANAARPAPNDTSTRRRAAPWALCTPPSGSLAAAPSTELTIRVALGGRIGHRTRRYAGFMPFGRYKVLDDGAPVGTEEFRCAPGPMGWRSFSQVQTSEPSPHAGTLDFAVDATWRVARLRIDTGEHDLLLEPTPGGDRLEGFRDRRPIEIAYGPDVHLDYFTPTTNAITTHRLTGTTEIDVVYLEPVTLE